MPWSAGTRLGPYEIAAPVGTGGMGEVYQALDTHLKRPVAIKVLPESVAGDVDRLARFQREAEVLAQLNHPNIAAIYGLEKSDGHSALVMELVEGPTLADRIADGPIPLKEALAIARQIASALDAAHEQGIVHRDLKPANIKVRSDGTVKVLDFGLAKAIEPAVAGYPELTQSPTLSLAATQVGVILGTAAYMSPEQARGKHVDKRADIWAFGVVLYEMVTSKRLFSGEDLSDTLATVMKVDPDLRAAPRDLQRLLRKCLEKDPRQRLRDIGDVWELLDSAATPAADAPRAPAAWLPWSAAAVLLGVAATLAVVHFREVPSAAEMVRFEFPAANAIANGGGSPVVSPDGRQVAFTAASAGANGRDQLWVHSLDTNESRALPGTEGAMGQPCWSPDSRSIAYATDDRKLRRLDLAGGPPQTVTSLTGFWRGGTWTRDANGAGVIVFGTIPFGGPGTGRAVGLMRVAEAGGAPTPVTLAEGQEFFHSQPQFLPDGRHFLYSRWSLGPQNGNAAIFIGSLDVKPEEQSKERLLSADAALYSTSSPLGSYLVFLRDRSLMAQAFNVSTLKLMGEAVPVADGFGSGPNADVFSVSTTGVLAYRKGANGTDAPKQLTWFDRAGKPLGTVGESGPFNTLSLSPDGLHLAVDRRAGTEASDLWVYDLARNTSTQLTFNPAQDWTPVWSGDSNSILFTTSRDGGSDLYRKDASGAGEDTPVLKSQNPKFAQDWSRDRKFVLFSAQGGSLVDLDVWMLPLDGKSKEQIYLKTDDMDSQARFSPDGRFVAYTSGVPGQFDVYVQPFPDPSKGKWKISAEGGGSQPRWRADGNEIFYISGDSKLVAVDVSTTPELFHVGARKTLFTVPIYGGGGVANVDRYDVSVDGKKFIVNAVPAAASGNETASPITVILNWQGLLKTR